MTSWQAQAEAWQKLASQTMAAWTSSTPPVVKDVAAGMMNGQAATLRYAEVIADAWRSVSTAAGEGRPWNDAVDAYVAQLRRTWAPDAGGWNAAGQDVAETWRLYLATLQRIMGPLGASLDASLGEARTWVGSAMAGDHSAFQDLTRLYWDAWEHTGGRLIDRHSFGLNREFDEKLLRGFDAWVDHRRALVEYQTVVAGASAEAVGAVMRTIAERAQQGKPIDSLRELTAVWTTVTDETMELAFRSEPYAAAQGRMLNAAMILRQHERAIAETFLKMTDIPARSDLDEAFKEIHTLRREVKALRREMNALKVHAENGGPA